MTKLIITSIAEREFHEAMLWYLEVSEEAANKFRKAFDRAVKRIESNPFLFQAYARKLRIYRLHRFPYLIVYRATKEAISIVGVVHGSRSPKIWKRR